MIVVGYGRVTQLVIICFSGRCALFKHRGEGAYALPLFGESDLSDMQRISVNDMSDMAGARFMESFEARHSDHSFTAAVVGRDDPCHFRKVAEKLCSRFLMLLHRDVHHHCIATIP